MEIVFIGLLAVLLFQAFVCAHFCWVLAMEKGYPEKHRRSWYWSGFWFGFIALFAAVGLPDRIAWTWDYNDYWQDLRPRTGSLPGSQPGSQETSSP